MDDDLDKPSRGEAIALDHLIVPARDPKAAQHGRHIVYWREPDGHVWEALPVSYARAPSATPGV